MYIRRAHLALGLAAATWVVFQPVMAAGEKKPDYTKKMNVGQLLYFNGNVDQAIKAFKTASSLKPEAVEPRLSLVNIYVQKQELDKAIEECHEIIKLKPNHKDVHLILGNLLRTKAGNAGTSEEDKKKLLDEAVVMIEKAQTLGADEALCDNTLGVIHVQKGDHEKSLHHINKALEKNPKLPDAHLIKGVLQFKKGDKDGSLKSLDAAIKHKGKNAEARCTKADILFSMGKPEDAMEEYKLASEDDPRYAQAWSGLGNIYISQKKYQEALDALGKAKDINANDKNIHYSLAVVYEKMGHPEQAIREFNEGLLLETDPMMGAQIKMHVQQLQQAGIFNIPSILSPGEATGPSLNTSMPGFDQSFKDLIKIKKKGGDKE